MICVLPKNVLWLKKEHISVISVRLVIPRMQQQHLWLSLIRESLSTNMVQSHVVDPMKITAKHKMLMFSSNKSPGHNQLDCCRNTGNRGSPEATFKKEIFEKQNKTKSRKQSSLGTRSEVGTSFNTRLGGSVSACVDSATPAHLLKYDVFQLCHHLWWQKSLVCVGREEML